MFSQIASRSCVTLKTQLLSSYDHLLVKGMSTLFTKFPKRSHKHRAKGKAVSFLLTALARRPV